MADAEKHFNEVSESGVVDDAELRELAEWSDLLGLQEGIGRVLVARLAAFDAATTPKALEQDAMGVTVLRRWLDQDLSADELQLLAAARGSRHDHP